LELQRYLVGRPPARASAPQGLTLEARCLSMTAKDAIKTALTSTQFLMTKYIEDLSDADLLIRPDPAANHTAWQLGHLISSEHSMGRQFPGASYPPLPAGWDDQHGK